MSHRIYYVWALMIFHYVNSINDIEYPKERSDTDVVEYNDEPCKLKRYTATNRTLIACYNIEGADKVESLSRYSFINTDRLSLQIYQSAELFSRDIRNCLLPIFTLTPGVDALLLESDKLKKLCNWTFTGYEYLEYLSIQNDPLELIQSGTFSKLARLKSLKLTNVSLSRWEFVSLRRSTSLESLDLGGNPKLGPGIIADTDPMAYTLRLNSLVISNTSITSEMLEMILNHVTFLPLNSLLDIRNNSIVFIPQSLTSLIDDNSVVYISGNPIACSCANAEFLIHYSSWQKSNPKQDASLSTTKCSFNKRFVNKVLQEVSRPNVIADKCHEGATPCPVYPPCDCSEVRALASLEIFCAFTNVRGLLNSKLLKFQANSSKKISNSDKGSRFLNHIFADLLLYKIVLHTEMLEYRISLPVNHLTIDSASNFIFRMIYTLADPLHLRSLSLVRDRIDGTLFDGSQLGDTSFPLLQYLNLSYNKITDVFINDDVAKKIPLLQILNVSHNSLQFFPSNASRLKLLKVLDLSDNRIKTLSALPLLLPPHNNNTNNNLYFLNFANNSIACDCGTMRFVQSFYANRLLPALPPDPDPDSSFYWINLEKVFLGSNLYKYEDPFGDSVCVLEDSSSTDTSPNPPMLHKLRDFALTKSLEKSCPSPLFKIDQRGILGGGGRFFRKLYPKYQRFGIYKSVALIVVITLVVGIVCVFLVRYLIKFQNLKEKPKPDPKKTAQNSNPKPQSKKQRGKVEDLSMKNCKKVEEDPKVVDKSIKSQNTVKQIDFKDDKTLFDYESVLSGNNIYYKQKLSL